MPLRKLATTAAFLATAVPAAAQTPSPAPPATTPNISVFTPTSELPGGQRLAALTNPKPQERIWVNTDYVLWFVQTVGVPELIQAVPTATAANQATIVGGADRLFPGQRELYFGGASGLRAQVGYRCSETWGLDASGFVLESRAVGGEGGGDGSFNSLGVGRPYTQAGTGTPIILYSNLPGQYSGATTAFANTQLWGLDGNIRHDTYRFMCDRNELLAGLRYMDLQESVTIRDTVRFTDGVTLAVEDVFRTTNRFFGSTGGFQAQWDSDKWHADLTTKFGLGFVQQKVESFGSNTFVSPTGAIDSEASGLYSRPFNQGTFERDKFAFVGELNLNVGYNITPHIRANIGYSIIYLSSVMRAGEAIDPVINDSRVRYVANPAPSDVNAPVFDWGRASDFWVQGLNFGFSVKY